MMSDFRYILQTVIYSVSRLFIIRDMELLQDIS